MRMKNEDEDEDDARLNSPPFASNRYKGCLIWLRDRDSHTKAMHRKAGLQ